MIRPKNIAVIGQGIIGLSTALRLLTIGHCVSVFSKDELPKTTSFSAGAYWWPHKAYPEKRIFKWAKETYDEYARQILNQKKGISFHEHYRFCQDRDECGYVREIVDVYHQLNPEEQYVSCVEAFRAIVPAVDVPDYLPALRQEVCSRGALISIQHIETPSHLFEEFDLVVNCSGVWSHFLVGDRTVYPVRGQTVQISNRTMLHESKRVYRQHGNFALVLPRKSDLVLGGTVDEGSWCLQPRHSETKSILSECSVLIAGIGDSEIIGVSVGLRPCRSEVRLELEMIAPGKPVIHNYGHGGSGYTVAWGCANEVANIVQKYFGSC